MATSDTATGPGSAARNTSRTSRRESIEIEIGTFPAGQLYYCHVFLIATWTCLHIFGSESKFDCPGFFPAGNKTRLSPPLLMLVENFFVLQICTFKYMGDFSQEGSLAGASLLPVFEL